MAQMHDADTLAFYDREAAAYAARQRGAHHQQVITSSLHLAGDLLHRHSGPHGSLGRHAQNAQ